MTSNYQATTMTVSDARGQLSTILEKTEDKNMYVLTKRGKPAAVLVGYDQWQDLQNRLRKIYQTTYIEPRLQAYTREFADEEIAEWEKEDKT